MSRYIKWGALALNVLLIVGIGLAYSPERVAGIVTAFIIAAIWAGTFWGGLILGGIEGDELLAAAISARRDAEEEARYWERLYDSLLLAAQQRGEPVRVGESDSTWGAA